MTDRLPSRCLTRREETALSRLHTGRSHIKSFILVEGRGATVLCILRRTPFVGTYFTFLFGSDWYKRKVLQCKFTEGNVHRGFFGYHLQLFERGEYFLQVVFFDLKKCTLFLNFQMFDCVNERASFNLMWCRLWFADSYVFVLRTFGSPDMTFAVDWALKTNYLSICPQNWRLVSRARAVDWTFATITLSVMTEYAVSVASNSSYVLTILPSSSLLRCSIGVFEERMGEVGGVGGIRERERERERDSEILCVCVCVWIYVRAWNLCAFVFLWAYLKLL